MDGPLSQRYTRPRLLKQQKSPSADRSPTWQTHTGDDTASTLVYTRLPALSKATLAFQGGFTHIHYVTDMLDARESIVC